MLPFRIVHGAPARDLVERTEAAFAELALRVHQADFQAGALQRFAFLAWRALPASEWVAFPKTPQIQSPISTRRSRSTPVLMPRPCSIYTTSSVATLPEAPAA